MTVPSYFHLFSCLKVGIATDNKDCYVSITYGTVSMYEDVTWVRVLHVGGHRPWLLHGTATHMVLCKGLEMQSMKLGYGNSTSDLRPFSTAVPRL